MALDPRPLQELMAPSGGLFRVVPVMQQEIAAAFEGALIGDPFSSILADAVLAAHRQTEAPADGAAMPCVGCSRGVAGLPRSYAVVMSDPPLLGRAFALPLCEVCGPEPKAIVAAAQGFLRQMWPEVRALPACVFAEGGRA